jgi:Flp pilus assembly protein TadG
MFRKFGSNTSGAAAVELAFVAPVIATMALVSFTVWEGASQRQNMRTALSAAAQYYLNGSSDNTIAQNIAMTSWQAKPADAAMSMVEYCTCGTTAIDCANLCTGNKKPSTYIKMTLTGTSTGSMFTSVLSEERTVRVR